MTNTTAVDIVVQFSGSCNSLSLDQFQNQFKGQTGSILQNTGVCAMENLYQLCNQELYSLQCGNKQRKKREINTETVDLIIKVWYPPRYELK